MPIKFTKEDWEFAERCTELNDGKIYSLRSLTAKLDYSYAGKTLWHSKSFQRFLDDDIFRMDGIDKDGSKIYTYNEQKLLNLAVKNFERIFKIGIIISKR